MSDVERIKEYFEVQDNTVIWKKSKGSRGIAGNRFGADKGRGYRHGSFDGKMICEHVVAFVLANNRFPSSSIDHINGNRSDNHPSNLREATNAENLWNMATRKDSKTGYKNVMLDTARNKYRVELRANGKKVFTQRFDSLEDAVVAAEKARQEHHGSFARSQ